MEMGAVSYVEFHGPAQQSAIIAGAAPWRAINHHAARVAPFEGSSAAGNAHPQTRPASTAVTELHFPDFCKLALP